MGFWQNTIATVPTRNVMKKSSHMLKHVVGPLCRARRPSRKLDRALYRYSTHWPAAPARGRYIYLRLKNIQNEQQCRLYRTRCADSTPPFTAYFTITYNDIVCQRSLQHRLWLSTWPGVTLPFSKMDVPKVVSAQPTLERKTVKNEIFSKRSTIFGYFYQLSLELLRTDLWWKADSSKDLALFRTNVGGC